MRFGSTPDEIENERKRLLIYAFTALGAVFLGGYGLLHLFRGAVVHGSILLAFLAASCLVAYIARRLERVQPASIGLASVLLFLSVYLVLGGGVEGTGPYWSYALSMLMVLLVGPKAGLIFMGLYLLINGLGLFGGFAFVYPYSEIEATRIVSASITLFVLILSSEWVRVGSYGAITLTSETLRQLADTDPLTSVLNRHGAQAALAAKSFDESPVVVILDVDRFKWVNDSHGHAFGDRVLVRLSALLRENTKGGDIVARWGGEEFLLVLFNVDGDAAHRLMERIRKAFGREIFDAGKEGISVTFSAGMSVMRGLSDFEAAVTRADNCLYKAKGQGRNQVVLEDATAP